MLFTRRYLDALAAGTISLAFRRWTYPTVQPDSRLRTPVGVLMIDAVEIVTESGITEKDAQRAGFSSRTEFLTQLDTHRDGLLYRIDLHVAGPDPREELRQRDTLTDDEIVEVKRRLARFDAASSRGPWTMTVLRLIADCSGTRAADLAASIDLDKERLKVNVRKLKELGLTESLMPGYRLSRRGRAVLDHLG